MGGSYFSKVISPKKNIIERLEFELTYYNVSIQHVNIYAAETPSRGSGTAFNMR